MERFKSRLGWALAGALGIVLVLALARATVAGPLDPPGPVASTMRTIDELLPSWGKKLSSTGGCASARFACVLPTTGNPSGEAVLDHETGLVWDRTAASPNAGYWDNQRLSCTGDFAGEREGWRLPSLQELQSIRDVNTADFLPAGHPFTGSSHVYWTQTPDNLSPGFYQVVTFDATAGDGSLDSRGGVASAWCVRGGAQHDPPAEPGSWSLRLSAVGGGCHTPRFSCIFDDTAVLDHETGLVWERSAGTVGITNWIAANQACFLSTTGGRRGWRSPTIQEAFSLADVAGGFPAGHPFLNVNISTNYFSSSSLTELSGYTFTFIPTVGTVTKTTGTGIAVWCVRGAGGQDSE